MRSLVSTLVAVACTAWPQPPTPDPRPLTSASGFAILSEDQGAWPHILSSIGFRPQPAGLAGVFVARQDAPAAANWPQRLKQGAILILEGASPLAAQLGFRPGSENVRVASIVDARRPKLSGRHPRSMRWRCSSLRQRC